MSKILIRLEQASNLQGCVLCYGHFTTIHPGHIRYLRHARSLGTTLVVALVGDGLSDQPSPYPFSQEERAEALSLLGIADAIVFLKADELSQAIQTLRPEVIVLGTELQGAQRLQQPLALLKAQGGSVQFHAGDVSYASVELLTSSEQVLRQQRRLQFAAACSRQGLGREQLLASMQSWPGATSSAQPPWWRHTSAP